MKFDSRVPWCAILVWCDWCLCIKSLIPCQALQSQARCFR